jgi:hypothetical protein
LQSKKNGNEKPKFTKEQLNVLLQELYNISTGALRKRKKNPIPSIRENDKEEETKGLAWTRTRSHNNLYKVGLMINLECSSNDEFSH